ncbi:WXG100 family type VII secretion target [Amycolatopsis anabasis]|uniref:WXG100 family type VII secretion target n=1 Tax=Amycolatopsis anabasis TaxID=1840409 RepID=UPI00131CD888|nr:hypothetical protein [Amycolatopsis anabasis]
MTDLDSAENRTATSGAGVVDTVRATAAAIQDEDWGEFAASAGVLALDGLAVAVDPVGAALSAGVGWLIEHFHPLTDLLNKVAGDPSAIQAGADAWTEVRKELDALAKEVPGLVQRDLPSWTGDARESYDQTAKEMTDGVRALSVSAGSAAAVVSTAGTMVATCRSLIRDIIAAVVAELIKGALAALATSVISFGATVAGYLTYAVGRIGMKVAEISAKIAKLLAKLGKAGAHLAKVLEDIASVGAKIGAKLGKAGGAVGKVAPGAGTKIASAGGDLGKVAAKVDDLGKGIGKGADTITGAADDVAGYASRVGAKGADRAARGRDLIDNAGDIGKNVGDKIRKGPLPDGRFRDFGEKVGLVNDGVKPNPIGIAARGIAYEPQTHEQNDAEDIAEGNAGAKYDQYDGYTYHGVHTGEHGKDGWYDRRQPPVEGTPR